MLRKTIRNNPALLNAYFFIDCFFCTLFNLNKNLVCDFLRSILLKRRGKNFIIIYCEARGHLQNICNIPELLIDHDSNTIVWVLCNFSNDSGVVDIWKENTRLRMCYNVLRKSLFLYACDLFISPADKVSAVLLPRSKFRIYLMHALVDIEGVYAKDAFDGYTHIGCATISQYEYLNKMNIDRRHKKQTLLRVGYPKLDMLLKLASKECCPSIDFIYAPTVVNRYNVNSATIKKYGYDVVKKLLSIGSMIFRPHPLSFKDSCGPEVNRITGEFNGNKNFYLDASVDYMNSYSTSKIMITDLSGTGFTYAFVFGRPVIFFSPNDTDEIGKSGLSYEGRYKIGCVVRDLSDLDSAVDYVVQNYQKLRKSSMDYRDSVVFNVGKSSEVFVQMVHDILIS